MNPYTRHLLRQVHRPDLAVLVEAWDALEALVVRVYRGAMVGPDDETEFSELRDALQGELARRRSELAPLWRSATVGGEAPPLDPFESILNRASAAAFIGDWAAMQTLPAARQALNSAILQPPTGPHSPLDPPTP